MNRVVPFLVCPIFVSAALAQGLSGGPLVGAAMAIGVQGGINGAGDAATHLHRNGFVQPPSPFPAAPTAPDLQQILTLHGASNLDIDDTSTGRDDIMVDPNGVIQPPPNGWGVFSFSFRDGAVGQPGSRLAQEPAADRGAAVFSWILPGSALPAPLLGVVERSHSRFELGLPAAGAADVDQLDVPLALGRDQQGLIATEPGFGGLLPLRPAIYFTVANSSLQAVPTSWWASPGVPMLRSGATIFRTLQSPASGQWSQPQVWKHFFELGLSQSEDIDALALDDSSELIIFSLVGNARDQLLFVDPNTDVATPQPVVKQDQTPVSQAVGSGGGDDIDAVCTLDPAVRGGLYFPDDFGTSCGTPRQPFQPALYPVGANASAFRRFENGVSSFDTWVLGWPSPTGRGPGWAVLLITIGDTTTPAITASIQLRNPGSSVPGDPRLFTQSIPAPWGLSGLPLTFRWFVADSSFTDLDQAYPIKVFL
ncbi:MAG: hypothetical protein KDC48_02125 [Planctomycetes bacterium]|nr:hypothetical protein [Planctomycetota bacterium]